MARPAIVHALVGMVLLAVASGSEAQAPAEAVTVVDPIDIPPESDPLAHAWDVPGERGGFYLRGSTGLGVSNVRLGAAPWEDGGFVANGFSTGYGLDLGGFLRPWLALHVDATIGVLWSGDLEADIGLEGSDGPDSRVVHYGFAPAVTFFTPRRFYLKPAFGVGFATIKSGNFSETTDPGFYMHLVAGKDLIAEDHFSMGLQFEVSYLRLGSGENDVASNLGQLGDSPEARIRQFLFGISFGFDSL